MKLNSYLQQSLCHLSDDALYQLFEQVGETVNSVPGITSLDDMECLRQEDTDFADIVALYIELVDIVCIRGLLKN